MGQFEGEYLPLAQEIVHLEGEMHDRENRVISGYESSPEAEAAERAWQNYLGSLAYAKAYHAFVADVGGPELTTDRIDAMDEELYELQVELGIIPEQEDDEDVPQYYVYDDETIAHYRRTHNGRVPEQISLGATNESLAARIQDMRRAADGLHDHVESEQIMQDAAFLESMRMRLFGHTEDVPLRELI